MRREAKVMRIADDVVIQWPWGTLWQAAAGKRPDLLRNILAMAKPGARMQTRINVSALRAAGLPKDPAAIAAAPPTAGRGR